MVNNPNTKLPKGLHRLTMRRVVLDPIGSSMQGVDRYTMESGMLTHPSDWDIEKIEI